MEVFDVRVSFDGANPSVRDTSIFTAFPPQSGHINLQLDKMV